MKQNAEKTSDEGADQGPDLHVVEKPRQEGNARTLRLPSSRRSRSSRPEIAVLGWDVRFYRLALRASKA
jgi:hypothetical protein